MAVRKALSTISHTIFYPQDKDASMTQEQRIIAVLAAIGGDVKALRLADGNLTALPTLAKDNLGKSLKTAIEALSGKGAKIKSVDAEGISPVIQYLEFSELSK